MAAKTVLNYLPRESVIHKLTGTTKLAFFLLFTFASMITYNTWVLLGLFAVSLAAFKLSKIKFREVRFMMIFMLVFLVLNNLSRESVIHKLTGTTKLAFFLLFTFASMITYNTWVLLGLFAVSLAAFKLSKIKFREVRFMMIFMLVFLVLNNLFIFLFDPNQGTTLYGTRHVLCHLFWRYDLTAEQLFYMVNISLKYFVALPVAILFISATNPSEFAASLNSIGISYKVGYSVAIALRYIPDIQRDYHSISQAQQARGVELGKNEHFFARLKNSVNILLPLILTSLNRIDTISNAMELRGFGKDKKRTWYMKRPFEKRDFVAIGVGVLLLAVSLTVTIRWGRFYNPFV